jgi:carboxymethylenebutenolidase
MTRQFLSGTAIVLLSSAAVAGAYGSRTVAMEKQESLPASGAQANARLAASPRKGEWVTIMAGQDSVRAWVVYPAQRQNAPVVVAVHDNQGMSNWIRAVADQLAADGFIGIAPDLLTMQGVARKPDGESELEGPQGVRALLSKVDQGMRDRYIQAVGEWGTKQPGASSRYGVTGFCWGGQTVFAHAVAAPASLGAVVVYYGPSPAPDRLGTVRAPILGLYGENDARVNNTVGPAQEALKAAGKPFEAHYFPGAGHGFTRSQEAQNGANAEAVKKAWPMTVAFFKKNLGR